MNIKRYILKALNKEIKDAPVRKASYLRREFGISEETNNRLLEKGKHKCWVCRASPKSNALHTDHWHWLEKVGIVVKQRKGSWIAYNVEAKIGDFLLPKRTFKVKEKTKAKAIRAVQLLLKAASVRGKLCWHCNTGLRKWLKRVEGTYGSTNVTMESAKDLRRAASYIDNYVKEIRGKYGVS